MGEYTKPLTPTPMPVLSLKTPRPSLSTLAGPPQRAAQVVRSRTAGDAIPVAYLMRIVGLKQSYLWAQVTNRFHLEWEHALLSRQGTMINE